MIEDEDHGPRKRLRYVGIFAGAITLGCLLLGQAAQQIAQNTAPAPNLTAANVKPKFNAIDYASTASIKNGVVVVGPCNTQSH